MRTTWALALLVVLTAVMGAVASSGRAQLAPPKQVHKIQATKAKPSAIRAEKNKKKRVTSTDAAYAMAYQKGLPQGHSAASK